VPSIDAAFVDRFEARIRNAADRLLQIEDAAAGEARAPGKWSRKEILGHLIDSAANNHVRFVRALATDDLVFDGYDQESWVSLQRYNERAWSDLIALWRAYNLHVAAVMRAADRSALDRPRTRHSLDRIAFAPVPANTPTTLAYLMADYVEHLEHHLRQVGIHAHAATTAPSTAASAR
jgi:hypothetical protein